MQEKWKSLLPYLEKYVGKKSLKEMSEVLNVEKEELRQFLHRSRRFHVIEENNLAYRTIKERFIYPEYFTPTKRFYKATGMGQRRWYIVYKGEKPITGKEFAALVKHLQINKRELTNSLQLQLELWDNDVL